MAAFIGTLIAETELAALELHEFKTQVYLWSDSQIVHFWISKSEGHPRQLITNRVKKIRDSIDEEPLRGNMFLQKRTPPIFSLEVAPSQTSDHPCCGKRGLVGCPIESFGQRGPSANSRSS